MMLDDTIEEWRPIERANGLYSISSFGRVRREAAGPGARVGYILAQKPNKYGYPQVGIYLTVGRQQWLRVHPLVVQAFLGPRPTPRHTHINHKDGVKSNNRLSNLEWATPAENARHAHDMGLTPPPPRPTTPPPHFVGEAHSGAKLTDADVRFIRSQERVTLTSLAARFGVGTSTIFRVRRGLSWAHVV